MIFSNIINALRKGGMGKKGGGIFGSALKKIRKDGKDDGPDTLGRGAEASPAAEATEDYTGRNPAVAGGTDFSPAAGDKRKKVLLGGSDYAKIISAGISRLGS